MIPTQTFLYFHTLDPLQVSWVMVDDSHRILQVRTEGALSDLPCEAKEHSLIVFVPAHDVLLTNATLPKLNRQRVRQALPYALEEQLISELGDLHFATSDYQADGTVPVAIVARKKMDAWLTLLKQFDIFPLGIFSAVFSLPFITHHAALLMTKNGWIIRQNKYSGFSAENNNADALLALALAQSKEKLEGLTLYNTLENAAPLKTNRVALHEIRMTRQTWLENMPTWFNENPGINLLQADYTAKHPLSRAKKIWVFAGYLAIAWVSLIFVNHVVSFFILHHHLVQQEKKIQLIYKKNFPQATSFVSPKERMEAKLMQATDDVNKNKFLVLLAKVSKNFSKNFHIQLKNIEFRDNQLTLALSAEKFDDLDRFTQALTQAGLNVKQQHTEISGERVKATLLVQGAA